MIGQTISHYKILEKLGEGGMGIVYKAEDLRLKKTVALKFLKQEALGSEEERTRFVHEAQASAALDHPNICPTYDVDQVEGPAGAAKHTFIVMAYIDGQGLKEKIASRPLPLNVVLDIAIQIAEGLQESHEKGIVHRDIKSANIMITSRGQAKIMDFGLAQLSGQTKVTKTGATVGTVAYMSPEQTRGENVDLRTDIWSLGVMLYEMVAGRLPFRGDYDQAVVYQILHDEPEPITSLRSNVPMELERIVAKAMQKNAGERYQHVDEMLVDLKSVSKRVEAGGPGEGTAAPRSLRRKRRLVYGGISIFAVLALAALYIFLPLKPVSVERKSIAVLPFKNMSDSKEDEYFSDGITEDIITHLSQIGGLTVISRTSIMQYKGTQKTIPEIGQELNVGAILEGSTRRMGDRIRIASQLIDVHSDAHLWAEEYDRNMVDVFDIQRDVARKIAQALKIALRPNNDEHARGTRTGNLTAYDYYLKGREYYYRFNKEDNEWAIDLFKKALHHEAVYAVALAGLADAYGQRVAKFGFPENWLDSAIALASKAISIDDGSAEAHKALGLAYSGKGWHRRAVQSYLKAVDLNPNYLTAVANIGAEYSFMGEFDEALAWFKKAVPLNPTFPFSYYNVGGTYSNLDDYEKARDWFSKCRALQPDFLYVHAALSLMYLRQGDYDRSFADAMRILSLVPDDLEALTLAGWSKLFAGDYTQAKGIFQKAAAIDSTNTFWYGCGRSSSTALGFIYLQIGQQAEGMNCLRRSRALDQIQLDQQSERYAIRYDLALINALEGKRTEAYQWLRRAIDYGWRDYHLGQRDPLLGNLQTDERFKEMIDVVRDSIGEMGKRVRELERE